MKKLALSLALLSVWLALPAFAADMPTCGSSGRPYKVKPNQLCYLLASNIGTASGSSAGPLTLPLVSTHHYGNLTVGFGNAPAGCTPGAFKIDWCATETCAAPAVPQTFVTLAGVADGELSSQIIPYVPALVYQARWTTIADSDCTAGGTDGIDVFIFVDVLD